MLTLEKRDFLRILSCLVLGELNKLGYTGWQDRVDPETSLLPETLTIDEAGMGVDSYDRMMLAGAVNRFFHLFESGIEDNLLRYRQLGDWADIVAQSWSHYSEQLTFETSGSTGEPKSCTHRTATLWQEAEFLARLLPGVRRVVSWVPCHHIYGFLFTVLLPKALNGDVVDWRQQAPQKAARQTEAGDVWVSYPLHWQYLVQSGLSLDPSLEVLGTTSTGPCAPSLLADLHARGLRRILEVYGSSETGGIGYRWESDAPYTLFPYYDRTDPNSEACDLIRRGADATAAVSVSFQPPDILSWASETAFRVVRRRDEAVQVGGINVFPSRVAAVIREHPAVADCVVRLMPHPQGDRLKALVVPRDRLTPEEVLNRELSAWIRERLSTPERPKSITFADAIPVGEQGKPADWSVQA
jgi:4-coumarate--CoA ligase (photoactive yellow protein activation family)